MNTKINYKNIWNIYFELIFCFSCKFMTIANSDLTFHIKIVLKYSEKPKIWISTMKNQVILLDVFFLSFWYCVCIIAFGKTNISPRIWNSEFMQNSWKNIDVFKSSDTINVVVFSIQRIELMSKYFCVDGINNSNFKPDAESSMQWTINALAHLMLSK